jgi:hypothetical protein
MNKGLLVMPLIMLALVTAILSGWVRIGWALPMSSVAAAHGSLMVNSFLASLIFLERAIAFKSKWLLWLPALNVFSFVAYISGHPLIGQCLQMAGSFGFLLLCCYFIYQYKELYYYVFLAAAFCLFTGNLILYIKQLYPLSTTWWMGFLLLTIVAERLELSRFLPVTKRKKNLLISALVLSVISIAIPFHNYGNLAFAFSISLVAVWLLRYDMAFYSIKVKGQHRYSGVLLIVGYVWLFFTAIFLITESRFSYGYDAALHSFFIGFVFSMIFSHAPIILPAVAGLPVKIYRPFLYVWFILLQLSLIIRVIADILEDAPCRKAAGLANGIFILAFFVSVLIILRIEVTRRRVTR